MIKDYVLVYTQDSTLKNIVKFVGIGIVYGYLRVSPNSPFQLTISVVRRFTFRFVAVDHFLWVYCRRFLFALSRTWQHKDNG